MVERRNRRSGELFWGCQRFGAESSFGSTKRIPAKWRSPRASSPGGTVRPCADHDAGLRTRRHACRPSSSDLGASSAPASMSALSDPFSWSHVHHQDEGREAHSTAPRIFRRTRRRSCLLSGKQRIEARCCTRGRTNGRTRSRRRCVRPVRGIRGGTSGLRKVAGSGRIRRESAEVVRSGAWPMRPRYQPAVLGPRAP